MTKVKGFDCVYLNKSGGLFYNVPTRKKRSSGSGYTRRFLKLKAEDILEAVKEIEKRKLHEKFTHLSPEARRKKLRELKKKAKVYKFNRESAERLADVIEFFSWRGFENFKLRVSNTIPDLEFERGLFIFNPKWVQKTPERELTVKIRGFVLRGSGA